MGYDIHITRAKRWDDSHTRPVLAHEWWACVLADEDLERADGEDALTADDPLQGGELAVWRGHPSGVLVLFEYSGGEIVVKNPDGPSIAKALAVARRLGAVVQGDDGETYYDARCAPRASPASLAQRWATWRDRWRAPALPEPDPAPFVPGDRVRDPRGEGAVISVDVRANHGLGLLRVRWDDGREVAYAAVGHGLTRGKAD